ncbi:hypothetical protein EPR50_G00165570 [Perca flavescens]|uniref:Uncharacterized protein n=1 Tax=Perca flavescens TaxID=8167 RepID=A0A484CCG3_PERFV|nr:hypothetical protein EPR50_G00165570 [Perca flavescens]
MKYPQKGATAPLPAAGDAASQPASPPGWKNFASTGNNRNTFHNFGFQRTRRRRREWIHALSQREKPKGHHLTGQEGCHSNTALHQV